MAVTSPERNSAMSLACERGDLETVKILLKHGDPKQVLIKNRVKCLPIHLAAMNGHFEIVKFLVQNGSPVHVCDSSDNFVTHYAAAYGFTDVLKLLITAGASIDVTNIWKLTPLLSLSSKAFPPAQKQFCTSQASISTPPIPMA
eukprot:GABV01003826.1.p1 GENE.GABV01003826.1~~GABV01003826.1.p1  ORF type:complete len:167 (-),score=67.54 GABV01003826.1:26-457(-)